MILFSCLFVRIANAQNEKENPTGLADTTYVIDSLNYVADSIVYNLKKEQIRLLNNAQINYKNSYISSDSIIINMKESTAYASGNIELKDAEQIIYGNGVFYDFESEQGLILSGRTKFEKGFYFGQRIRKVGPKIFDIDNAAFTTCDNVNPHYEIRSIRLRLYVGDKIVAKPIVLYVNHFPIFALPFGTISIKRARESGFLIPEPGYNNREGKFIKDIAYYQTFGEYGDATLSFDYMEYTGWQFILDTRYKTRYTLNGNLTSKFIRYNLGPYDYRYHWLISAFHRQRFSCTSNLSIRLNFVSDQTVRQISDDKQVRMDKTLTSYLSYSKSWRASSFSLTMDYREDLDTRHKSLKFPSASFILSSRPVYEIVAKATQEPNYNILHSWLGKLYFSYRNNILHTATINVTSPTASQFFYHNSYDKEGNILSNHREGIKHNLSLSYVDKIKGWLNLSQAFRYNEVWLDKDNKSINRGYDYNTSSSFSFSIYGIFSTNVGRLKALRHIISPNISFSYAPDFSNINKDIDNFSGISISKSKRSKRMSISINNKLQAKLSTKEGKLKRLNQLLTISSSTGYDFEKTGKHFSDISHSLRINPGKLSLKSTNITLSNTLRLIQDFYSLEPKNYSLSAKISLTGNLFYNTYFHHQKVDFPCFKSSRNQEFKKSRVQEIKKSRNNENQESEGRRQKAEIQNSHAETKPEKKRWNVSSSFSYNKNKQTGYYSSNLHNSIEFNLTMNWKISYSNYYNFKEKRLVSQSLRIYRDLHCWSASLSWEKSGDIWSYRFKINVKALPNDIMFRFSDRKKYYD